MEEYAQTNTEKEQKNKICENSLQLQSTKQIKI